MRLEHQIKNVVTEKYTDTPGQTSGNQEHELSKKTSDYEAKYFQHASTEDDRKDFIKGKSKEHADNVEDKAHKDGKSNKVKGQEGKSANSEVEEVIGEVAYKLQGPTVKFDLKKMKELAKKDNFIAIAMKNNDPKTIFNTYVAQNAAVINKYLEEKEDMNIDLKQVETLSEKRTKPEEETFMGAIAHAASQGKKEVKIGGKTHPVHMKPETHKAIKKNKKGEEQVKENLTFEEAVRAAQAKGSVNTQKYWEQAAAEKQEGWGAKPGLPGKGKVTPGKRIYKQMQEVEPKKK